MFDAVKAKEAVIVWIRNWFEENGKGYDIDYRCYGSLRLVSYAQFLLREFYPKLIRICAGEGVAMRTYAMGDADAALIELQVEHTEAFKDRFFGRKAPVLPSAKIIEFENRWRERQLAGPITCGSLIYSDKISRQI